MPPELAERILDTWDSMAAFESAVTDAVLDAGGEVLKHYARHSGDEIVSRKADDSPLTQADLASHQLLKTRLDDILPGIPVLSEEGSAPPATVREAWSAFWLVDPLDGTKEFLNKNGQFTVNVALVSGGRPVFGVVHAPELSTTYLGAAGRGAFKAASVAGNGLGEPEDIQASAYARGPLRCVVSRSHLDGSTLRFLEAIEAEGTTVERVEMGSSLKLCLIAEGAAHLYPRFAPTMWWDIAAGQAVVEAAGGSVRTLDGQPLQYDGKNLRNPFFIATGQKSMPWQDVLNAVRPEELVKPRE
jgi:3'(2'), 5'-bisphosphate nucleotidase